MSSVGLRYRAIETCAGYLRGQTTPIGLQTQFRLASTTAKSGGTKRTRFAGKKTLTPDAKISQTEVPQIPSKKTTTAPTTTGSTETVHTQSIPEVAAPLSRRPARTPRITEAEAEAPLTTKKRLDPRSKEYQAAYKAKLRKYTALMVSIPLAIVTSFFLFKKREWTSPLILSIFIL